MSGSVMYFDSLFINQLKNLKPKKVLDVGVGSGKWGRIVKNEFPDCEVHGVEPEISYTKKYETETIYDKIFNKSIQQFIREDMNNQESYDLVICGDVLEHLFLSEVHDVLDFFSYRCKWLITQFPSNVTQHAIDGINWEVHRSNLKLNDFTKYNICYFSLIKEKDTNVVFHHYLILSMFLNFQGIMPTNIPT